MPIYEFSCHTCAHEFEQIVSFSATTMPTCPACQSTEVGRHMSRPAIHFKGSGWYITDSRKGSGKKTDTAGASGNAKSDESSTSKSSANGDSGSTESTESTTTRTETPKAAESTVKAAAD